MKKKLIITSILIVLMFSLFSIAQGVKAAEAKSIEMNLAGNKTVKKDAKTIEVSLSLGQFIGVEENIVLGYQATMEYDKDMFSSVTAKGENGWTVTPPEGPAIVGELATPTAKANTKIATFTLTLKDGVTPGTSGTFKLNNLKLSDGEDFEVTDNKSITITVEEEKTPATTPQTTPTSEQGETPKQQTQQQTPVAKTTTQQQTTSTKQTGSSQTKTTSTLPKAGAQNYIVITFLIVSIIGIFAFIRYKTIKIK